MRDTTRLALARALAPVVRQLVIDCPAMHSDDESRAASERVALALERAEAPTYDDIGRLVPRALDASLGGCLKNACLRSAVHYLVRALGGEGAVESPIGCTPERALSEVLVLIAMYEEAD